MFSVIRRGIITGILVALSGGILLPAAAQPDGLSRDMTVSEQAVAELRELAERFPADAQIAHQLAQRLLYLFWEQDVTGREQTVAEVRGLAERFPDHAQITLRLAQHTISPMRRI